MIKGVRSENEEYRRKLIESGDLGRRNGELEARIASLTADIQQIQQINEVSRVKISEYENRFR